MHLTNYSVNKDHENFTYNRDNDLDDVGNKWSLSALFSFLSKFGIDTDLLWS